VKGTLLTTLDCALNWSINTRRQCGVISQNVFSLGFDSCAATFLWRWMQLSLNEGVQNSTGCSSLKFGGNRSISNEVTAANRDAPDQTNLGGNYF
jgi:hypothetical protein